jgi:hypothetical protein
MKKMSERRRSENELLLAVARRELDPAAVIAVRELVRQPLDWHYVLATAFSHGLMPLLQKNLTTSAADLVPVEVMGRLKRESVANSQSVLHLIGKQLKVYRLLKEAGIRVAIFKGAVLAQMAYGEVSLRQAGDIDLLIDRHHFAEARSLLQSLGYEMAPRLTEAQWLRTSRFTVKYRSCATNGSRSSTCTGGYRLVVLFSGWKQVK